VWRCDVPPPPPKYVLVAWCSKFTSICFWAQTYFVTVCSSGFHFLSVFAKLRKAFISFVVSVRLAVHMEQIGLQEVDFHEIRYLSFFFFRKSVEKIQVLLKSEKNIGYFTCRRFYINVNISQNSS
jgi:hypothetical protein